MSTLYTAVVYPQAGPNGFSYAASVPNGVTSYYGVVPSTCTIMAYNSPTWNPYSTNAADRTQYWEDSAGTLTLEQVLQRCYGNSGYATQVSNNLKTQAGTNISSGITVDVNGSSYVFTMSQNDQINAQAAFSSALAASQNAKAWAASTAETAYTSVVEVNNNYYIAYTSGSTGSTEPTFTTEFSTPVTDGSVTWYLFGIVLGTTTGNVYFTVQEILSIYPQLVAAVNAQRGSYTKAKSLATAASSASLESVSTTYATGSYVIDSNNNLYQATVGGTSGSTLPTYNTTVGGTTTDGSITWTCLGNLITYLNNITL
jgi:hypothetical protein